VRDNGTELRAELHALVADPPQVARLPLDRIPALRAGIRALRLPPRGPRPVVPIAVAFNVRDAVQAADGDAAATAGDKAGRARGGAAARGGGAR
jgi:hypothetical protein